MNSKLHTMSKTFRALSDETRLRILKLLIGQECSVCQVKQAMQLSQTRASRNLRILYDAGFLNVRQHGLWVLYKANDEAPLEPYSSLTKIVGNFLADDEIATRDRERLKALVGGSPHAESTNRRGGQGR